MNFKRGLGIVLIFIGLFMVVITKNITGAVIGFGPENYAGFFGVLIFVIGVFLVFVSAEKLENKVILFDALPRATTLGPDKRYQLMASDLYFKNEKGGMINLGEVKRGYDKIRDDGELVGILRDDWGPKLLKIVQEDDEERAKIAMEFLRVIYDGKVPVVEEAESEIDRAKIFDAFKSGYKIDFTPTQKKVLKMNNLGSRISRRGGHIEVFSLDTGKTVTTAPKTPRGSYGGVNVASQIYRFLKGE